ncbi:uncharacterized protein C8Q71DRAFT_862406 [Rhodofomes roseus]|uniref:Zn(2)-C6 fungal-type domain-containing protein n=2 Tax=Rhodofomes roseus TaxID=34475 RepID=A0ABQ8K1V0_9APHY|nr:uncharacterized protein C8Q71DRAFT_862406 [Rhodofomes roseus]KAH9830659.1 hypothetical protein C8Q71DRAFT_862406 [Rhodofomes roseus]
MVGTLSFGDFLSLQAAGLIGLPDYSPDHVDVHILDGLDRTFRSLVESPFDWHAIGNIAFHILSNDHFMQTLDAWIESQGGEVQLPPWVEEFREWQYPEEDSSGNAVPEKSLHRRLVSARLWDDKDEMNELESRWTSNGWMPVSIGEYLEVDANRQPEADLAEWLAAHPDVECFPRAWCTSEDGTHSVGNAEDFLDVEAQEDFNMQEDEQDEDAFDDLGEDVQSGAEILVEGSIGNDRWYLNSQGQFFMNNELYPKSNFGEERCLACKKMGFTECTREFSGSSCWNCRDRKVKCSVSGGVPGSKYAPIYSKCLGVGFDLEIHQFVRPRPVDAVNTPSSNTSALPPPSTTTEGSRSSRRNLPSHDEVADDDLPVVLNLLRRQLDVQPDASGSGAGPGPSTQQHSQQNVNLQILNALERINQRLDRMETEEISRPVRRSKKSRGKGKGKNSGKGKGRAQEDFDDDDYE